MHYDPIFIPHPHLEQISLPLNRRWQDAYRWIDICPALLSNGRLYIPRRNALPLFVLHFILGVN